MKLKRREETRSLPIDSEKNLDPQLNEVKMLSSDCKKAKKRFESSALVLSITKSGTCNLGPEEMIMIKYYTDSFGCINSYLRQTSIKDPHLDLLIATLNNGLDKLPNYQGIVKRGVNLTATLRDQHIPGKTITYPAFTSTSTYEGFKSEDIFYIYSKTGKPIMGFSTHDIESEVLFKKGTKFKVLDKKAARGINYYIMKEVLESDKEDSDEIDKRLIEQVRNPPAVAEKLFDRYSCPVKVTDKIPVAIKQIRLPQMNYPK